MQFSVPYKTLVIVESPSKCKTIESILGIQYMCVATCGHIRDLALYPDLSNVGQMLKTQTIPYTNSHKKTSQIRLLQSAYAKCNGNVILATDADREGESIAWHVCEILGLPIQTTPRIIFKEITSSAIHNALKHPTIININLVRAQQARQIIDFIIGYGVTPVLWNLLKQSPQFKTNNDIHSSKKIIQSAGRCQTPALRIMYDAYFKMQNVASNPIIKYNCVAEFTRYNMKFRMTKKLSPEEFDTFLDFYTNSETRDQMSSSHIFELHPVQEKIYKPPPPFKTTSLQQAISSYMHLTPYETMEIAQKLYESGYITYHRTESTLISSEFKKSVRTFIQTNWNEAYLSDDKSTLDPSSSHHDYAHEAIRPVNVLIINLPETFNKAEQLLYTFIWTRAVCSCMQNSVYEMLTSEVTVNTSFSSSNSIKQPIYSYIYTAYRQKISGWRACIARYGVKVLQAQQNLKNELNEVTELDETDRDCHADIIVDFQSPQYNSDHFTYLQSISPGTKLPYKTICCKPVVTNVFVPYTYTKLISRLENMGIGRPSTFASIVHTLKKRDYIQNEQPPLIHDHDPHDNTSEHKNTYKTHIITNYDHAPESLYTYNSTTISDTANDNLKKTKMAKQNKTQIHITSNGENVINALYPLYEPLFSYEYTRDMENRLDMVANGNTLWVDVCKETFDQMDKLKKQSTALIGENQNAPNDLSMNSIPNENNSIVRIIDNNTSIRNGKYGPYVYYKTPSMKKPKFIPLKGFPYTYTECNVELVSHWVDKHI